MDKIDTINQEPKFKIMIKCMVNSVIVLTKQFENMKLKSTYHTIRNYSAFSKTS